MSVVAIRTPKHRWVDVGSKPRNAGGKFIRTHCLTTESTGLFAIIRKSPFECFRIPVKNAGENEACVAEGKKADNCKRLQKLHLEP